MSSHSRSLPLVALALAAAVLVVQARVVLGGKTWDDVRYHTVTAPPRLAAAAAVQHRELPAWWDGTGLGVPLYAEPSHGAAYPPAYFAATPRALDLLLVLHVLWAALGVALWARRRASDAGALVAGMLAATTGILAGCALAGSLFAVAQLPWIGWAASELGEAPDRATRARRAAVLAVLLGAVGLAGQLGVLIDALVLAVALAARRASWRYLAAAIAAGLAIGGALWIPAIHAIAAGTGATAEPIPIVRLVELVLPVAFGGDRAAQASAVADLHSAAPSLYVGVPLIALALVRGTSRRVTRPALAFGALALIAGRGSWPAWLGAPELHVAALALIAAVHAGAGVDALVAGERRAQGLLALGAGVLVLALAGLGGLRSNHDALAPVLDGALLAGALGLVCVIAALAIVRRVRATAAWRTPALLALLVAPGVIATPAISPVVSRAVVTEAPAWARAARTTTPPRRVFRQPELPRGKHEGPPRLAEAIATLAGTSGARWGLAVAPTTDPARAPAEDATWFAAAHEGDALFDRFGIAVAVLPIVVAGQRPENELGRIGHSSLARIPVVTAPVAVYGAWDWAHDDTTALAELFPEGGGARAGRGRVVLAGAGPASPHASAPVSCELVDWSAGAIEADCTAPQPGYAVVSSAAAPGWTARVDGQPAPWLRADVVRRAVALPEGPHRIAWRYHVPGLPLGIVLTALGIALAAALWLAGARHAPADPRNS